MRNGDPVATKHLRKMSAALIYHHSCPSFAHERIRSTQSTLPLPYDEPRLRPRPDRNDSPHMSEQATLCKFEAQPTLAQPNLVTCAHSTKRGGKG